MTEVVPQIDKSATSPVLIAVDIGNSGMKLGRFARDRNTSGVGGHSSVNQQWLPTPSATLELPIAHATGAFDSSQLSDWCGSNASADTRWSIGSVHRGAGQLLVETISTWAQRLSVVWPIRELTPQEFPMPIRVDEPTRVGIDRLLAALAANRLRANEKAAIVIDLGTAITVDLVEADGAFAGGAILPGIGTAGSALADQTDALPHIQLSHSSAPPAALGKSTTAAIEAGLYWGAVGAIEKLIAQLSQGMTSPPDLFITGGAASAVVKSMDSNVRYVPHLVLAGIALLEFDNPGAKKG
jgi:type III pantothenate kinase